MEKDKDLLNITRFDYEKEGKAGQHGWWVRLQKSGKKFQNFFNDGKYGGKEEALKAAKIFRDAIKLQMTVDVSDYSRYTSRNKSGVVGVSRIERPERKGQHSYIRRAWCAHWRDEEGKRKSLSFSVDKYGEEEAFRRAFEARQKGIAKRVSRAPTLFKSPDNVCQPIWRYLDFTKFVSLLETSALYFSNVDSLNDPFEGSFSKINESFRHLIHKHEELTPEMVTEKVREMRKSVYVNCWHMSDYESAAMWELYSKSNEAVCVQSTYEAYLQQLGDQADIGVIQYVSYEEDYIPEHDPYLAFLYKRKSFEHEREIRGLLRSEKIKGAGVLIPVDVEQLVQRVFISPTAPEWFFNLVKDVVDRYRYRFKVCQSSLAEEPFF